MADFENNYAKTEYDGLNLPYSSEAEQAVLGAIIFEPECLDRVTEILSTLTLQQAKPTLLVLLRIHLPPLTWRFMPV